MVLLEDERIMQNWRLTDVPAVHFVVIDGTLGEGRTAAARFDAQHVLRAAFRCFRLGGGQMLPRQLRVCHRSCCTAFAKAADTNLVPLNISRPCADGALE